MARITTVDYSTLQKQSVGRPKTTLDKGTDVFCVTLKTNLSNDFSKVKFKIRNGVPAIYFTNRETNIIKDNEYLNEIKNSSFNLQYSDLKEGIYNISSVGYHWFELELTNKETNNCCIIKKI